MKWHQELCEQNPQYKAFEGQGVWLVRDDTYALEVIEKHAVIEQNTALLNSFYHQLVVKGMSDKEGKTFVPIIPGYSIITYISKSFFRFTIEKNQEDLLNHVWVDYGNDKTLTQVIYQTSNSDFFSSFHSYIKNRRKGHISIPNILGLNNPENVNYLRAVVIQKYPDTFINFTDKRILEAEKKTKSIQSQMKRKGEIIVKGISGVNEDFSPHTTTKKVKSGIIINEKGLELDNKATQGLLVEYTEYKQKYYQANKKYKRAKENVTRARESTSHVDEQLIEQDDINDVVKQAINNNNLGSTIFINTQQYLTLLFGLPCINCEDKFINNKRHEIFNVGFSVRITIRCLTCDSIAEYSNESLNSGFNLLVTGSSLVAGLNRQQNETFLASMGITNQICKKTFHNNQKRFFQTLTMEAEESAKDTLMECINHIKSLDQNILSVSFDTSWSHVRNANQASGEFIFQGNHPGNYIFFIRLRNKITEK